jgi:hypothetical protein
MKNLVVGIAFLFAANVAFAQGIAQDVDTLETDVDTLEGQVASLQTENAQLQAVIASLTAVVDNLVELQRCHAIGGSMGRTVSEGGNHGVDWRGFVLSLSVHITAVSSSSRFWSMLTCVVQTLAVHTFWVSTLVVLTSKVLILQTRT